MRKGAIEAVRLRDQGLLIREIAERMGLARSSVAVLLCDPNGLQDRTRRARYGGTCEVCGGPTDGSNGRAKAPTRCTKCRPRAEHGTRSRYATCRCDACRKANAEYRRARRAQRRAAA